MKMLRQLLPVLTIDRDQVHLDLPWLGRHSLVLSIAVLEKD